MLVLERLLIYIVPTCAGSVQPAALLAVRNSPTRSARLASTRISTSRGSDVRASSAWSVGLKIYVAPTQMLSRELVYTLMLAPFPTLDFLD